MIPLLVLVDEILANQIVPKSSYKGIHDDEASVNISRSQVWRRRRETHPRLASVFMKSSFKLVMMII